MLLGAIYDHSGPKLHVFGPIITFCNTDMYLVSKIFLGHSRSFCHLTADLKGSRPYEEKLKLHIFSSNSYIFNTDSILFLHIILGLLLLLFEFFYYLKLFYIIGSCSNFMR